MRIAIIGTGYVGLVSGACFAEFGHQVVCIDKDAAKIDKLRQGVIPIYEPGLEHLVLSNVAAKRLTFRTDLSRAVARADAVFIAVGTPSRRGDGHADLSYVFAAAEELAPHLHNYTVVVTKSTVPVGTGRQVAEKIRAVNPQAQFDIASNPEFLREGSAIGDFMRPDRVLVGADTAKAAQVLKDLYRPLFLLETPMVVTSLETAELTKYAANAFLAMKITFINEIADLCDKVGANVQDVAKGIGLDGRIGKKFLHAGPGYGGSCFPKDTLALLRTARDVDAPLRLIEATVAVNDTRKAGLAGRVIAACGGSVAGKTIAVLGVTFKPETDDMRDAPSLALIPALQKAGATVAAFDPAGMHEAEKLLPNVRWGEDAYAVAKGADALVLLTEWNAFRALDFAALKETLKTPLLVDFRNVYAPEEVAAAGFAYVSVGRPVK
ncbi:MAG: UDP-glucose dehydrogenase family protein [Holosporales bacterium]|jgi:UDPglucose 6-dehydrogenase